MVAAGRAQDASRADAVGALKLKGIMGNPLAYAAAAGGCLVLACLVRYLCGTTRPKAD